MKINLLLILMLFSFQSSSVLATAKFDTTDSWHVSYNNKMISRFDAESRQRIITIKTTTVKPDDILTVEYWIDAPNPEAKIGIYVIDGLHNKIMLMEGKGSNIQLKIPVSKLLEVCKQVKKQQLELYYFDDRRNKYIFRLIVKNN